MEDTLDTRPDQTVDEQELKPEEDEDREKPDDDLLKSAPRSVFNLIYDSEYEEEESTHSSRSYLTEDDLPLPQIPDSDDERCTACGECCDCCEVCLRKRKNLPKCKCGWVRNVIYYAATNALMVAFFFFVMYMSQVNYYQNPESPPFKQLMFKPNQYPGLTLIPSMHNIQKTPTAVIWYTMKGKDSPSNRRASSYVKEIKSFLYDQTRACQTAKGCLIDTSLWGPCKKPDFGYTEKQPCIFLKLNRLTLWEPKEYYDVASIPDDIPEILRKVIDVKQSSIWVHCKGATDYDEEKIGEILYYPGPYFNSSFFPIDGQMKNNPLMVIQLTNVKPGYAVKLECGLYAKNLHKPKAFGTFIYIKD